jgi:hypothetical protein
VEDIPLMLLVLISYYSDTKIMRMCLMSYLLHSWPQVAQVIISEGGLMAMYSGVECVSTLMNSTQLTV